MNTQNVSMTVKELPVEKVNRLASELADALNEWMDGQYMACVQPRRSVMGSPVAYRNISAPATERIPYSPSRTDIKRLSMVEMLDLYQGVVSLGDYVAALINQPRYSMPGQDELNAVGRIIDGLAEVLSDLESRIAQAAKQTAPVDAQSEKARALILLQQVVDGREDIADIAAVATSFDGSAQV